MNRQLTRLKKTGWIAVIMICMIFTALFVSTNVYADYEDGMECPECGNWRYDDWLACDECGICIDCIDEYHFCPDCEGCNYYRDYCAGCGFCEGCALICPDCGEHCDNCCEDEICLNCGCCTSCNADTLCPDCHETCFECEYRQQCGNCYLCSGCAEDICEDCEEHCTECDDMFCMQCGTCSSCNGGTTCPECHEACGECGDLCYECNRCFNCTTVCDSCGELCVECDDGFCLGCNYCSNCNGGTACEGCNETCLECQSKNQCLDCYACEDCADALCEGCGEICSECDGGFCFGCNFCENCNGGTACEGCHETCLECQSKNQCLECLLCSDCTPVCDSCGEICAECDEGMCLNCYTCSDCNGETACPDCRESCDNCTNRVQCPECWRCEDCAEICENCGQICEYCDSDFDHDYLLCSSCQYELFQIYEQPSSVTASVGTTVTLSVEADGFELDYQWQYKNKTDTNWTNASGASAKYADWTLTVAAVHYGFDFRCVITDVYQHTKTTNTVQINPTLHITTQPTDKTAAAGGSVVLSVRASGSGTLTYQWQYKKNADKTWTNASGKTADWTLTVASVHYGFDFRCMVKESSGYAVYSKTVHINPPVSVTTQPTDKMAEVGSSVTLSVKAAGLGTLAYQWQYKQKSATSWSDAGGASAKTANWTLTVAEVHYGFDFRCKVTNSYGNTAYSDTVHIYPALRITTQPADMTSDTGKTVTMSVKAAGTGTLSYQWQYKKKTETTWSNASGASAKTADWALTVASVHYGFDFRCKVTSTNGKTVYSNTVHIHSLITVNTQPTNKTAAVGTSVTMKVVASGTGLTYQWQYKNKTGTAWSNSTAASAKTASWTLTVAAVHYGFDFRCKVTDSYGTVKYTNIVHITSPTAVITTQPTDKTAAAGESVTMTVGAAGSGLSYQWQYKKKSDTTWSNASGTSAKTANWTLTVAEVHYGFDFRCKVTDSGSHTAYTNTVHINPKITITTEPTDKTAAVGTQVTLKVAATGTGTLSYQWQYKKKADTTWTNASGKTASWTLTVSSVHYGFDFRCKVSDSSGNAVYSKTVHINQPALTITTQPTDKTAATGTQVTLKVAASGGGTLSYQWQYKQKSASTWSDASGKTASWTLTVAEVHYGFDFRCKVSDSSGNAVYSKTVHISKPTLTITEQPADKTAAVGTQVAMKIFASGAGTLSYQWQYKQKSATTWTNASGKTATWNLTVASVHYGFDFRCKVSDTYGNVKYSNVVHIRPTLTITTQPVNKTAAVGTQVTMKVVASGTGTLSYQWQYKQKSATTWSDASGKTATWNLTVASVHYGFDFRCKVTDTYGNVKYSNTVHINQP